MYVAKEASMEKSFTGLDEFMDNISRGGEVEFMYKGRAYFAGLTKVGEYSVYEQGNYSSERCYTTPEGVCAYRIGAETLGEIITKAAITFRCLS